MTEPPQAPLFLRFILFYLLVQSNHICTSFKNQIVLQGLFLNQCSLFPPFLYFSLHGDNHFDSFSEPFVICTHLTKCLFCSFLIVLVTGITCQVPTSECEAFALFHRRPRSYQTQASSQPGSLPVKFYLGNSEFSVYVMISKG